MMNFSDDEIISLLQGRLKSKQLADSDVHKQLQFVSNKLKQSEQLKSHFLSNIRNEINNPLASVLGLSSAMMSADDLDLVQIQRYAYLIHNEIFNLHFQMKNIFAAAEIEAGEMRMHYAPVEVKRLSEEVIEALSFKAGRKRVTIRTSFNITKEIFVSDAYMLNLVFMNLIANAIEYSPEGAEVDVWVSVGNTLHVNFCDRGKGIEQTDYKKIFERFKQLDQGATKSHSGHGLGLSITSALIDMLGGELLVDSSPARGSKFTIIVPEGKAMSLSNDDWNEFLFENGGVV